MADAFVIVDKTHLGQQVLVKVAAEGDVYELKAAADGEDRLFAGEEGLAELELVRVAEGVQLDAVV